MKRNNVFEAILKYGHDEDFVPEIDNEFAATDAPPARTKKLRHSANESNRVIPFGTTKIVVITQDSPVLFAPASNCR